MKITSDQLRTLTSKIFAAAGCNQTEADCVARHLVDANLAGHDSHGVIRVPTYVQWLSEGAVVANRAAQIIFENDAIAIVDGQFGLGQAICEQAVQIGIEKSVKHGVSVVALRNTGHVGRVGDWPLIAAKANKLSLHFVNTTGKGMLVAPFGGIDRRLSANPIAAGVPVAGGEPIVLDISACTIAEGKIRVALNQGVTVPNGCLIDSEGNPTNEPEVFYADPPGAILPFGAHKGHGLGVIVEMLAGALSGSGCTNPANASRLVNGMLSIFLDPTVFAETADFQREVSRFIAFVKSARTVSPDGQILMPGEIEVQNRAQRLEHGIELDAQTWSQLCATAASLGVDHKE